MLDHWLDDYEALWHGAREPPSLRRFLERLPASEATAITQELALIDLEQRWRHYYSLPSSTDDRVAGMPRLPLWADYCCSLPGCEMSSLEGILHEFRVRQLFGDRPHYRQVMKPYPAVADELAKQLPDVAAATTRATVTVLEYGGRCYSCRLPGRMEIGRQRAGEPAGIALVPGSPSHRLLIAAFPINHISRTQCQLEVVAKGRIFLRHTGSKGTVGLDSGQQLHKNDSCELELPVALNFHGRTVQISCV